MVIPPLAVTYLTFGQKTWVTRLGHLLASLSALVVSAGWWVAAVELWPKSSRPYIGGSQNNSILELTFGYNGFGRLTGDETGSVVPGGGNRGGSAAGHAMGGVGGSGGTGAPGGMGGPPGMGGRGGGMWGQTGFLRMFQEAQGGQIAWLIPTALILGAVGIILCGKAPRTDLKRAFFAVWGLWLLVTMAVFSYMSGIFHQYYTVALAPAIAALVGGGALMAWRARDRWWVRITLAATIVVTGVMSFVLLNRTTDFVPWLRYAVLVVAIAGAVVILIPKIRSVSIIAAALALTAGLAGPAAYAIDTIGTAHQGSIPSAGPRGQGFGFGPGGGHWGGRNGGGFMGMPPGMGGMPGGGNGQMPGGGNGQVPGMPGGGSQMPGGNGHMAGGQAGTTGSQDGWGRGDRGMMGGPGGFLEGSKPSQEMQDLLNAVPSSYTWVAAAIGSNSASGYQLATQRAVMPIGGFNGSDPSPTLDEFKSDVAAGKIYYFIAGGRMGGGMNAEGTASSITDWVESNFISKTVGSTTVYDLTQPKS